MISISVDTSGLDLEKVIGAKCSFAEHFLAEEILKDTSPFVPFRTGSLDTRAHVEGGTVIYPGPYARYLYYGKLMVDPETGSPWARRGATKVLTDRNLVFSKAGHPQAQSHWFEASKAQNMDKWERQFGEAMKKYGE